MGLPKYFLYKTVSLLEAVAVAEIKPPSTFFYSWLDMVSGSQSRCQDPLQWLREIFIGSPDQMGGILSINFTST